MTDTHPSIPFFWCMFLSYEIEEQGWKGGPLALVLRRESDSES